MREIHVLKEYAVGLTRLQYTEVFILARNEADATEKAQAALDEDSLEWETDEATIESIRETP